MASVGEYQSVKVLIGKLIENYKINILITSVTVSAANIIKKDLSSSLLHQYIPIDNIIIVNTISK